MTVCVFVGPTLRREEARSELNAIYLPPVSQGDVYRAVRAGARTIGIIDGYFERIPAVWHKEILWAMSEGVHVFGSASMGALRAAELAVFGMVGVGSIFEAFASGALEDDDEVAVAHGPAEMGFRAGSEAMVNIRATLMAAREARVIDDSTAAVLERTAKGLFYPDRSYPTILRRCGADLSTSNLAALEAWLPKGRLDLKRQDALAMLRAMREHIASEPPPKRVRYAFERTVWWEQATITAGELHLDGAGGDRGEHVLLQGLIEEAQLEGTFAVAHDAALLRHLAVRYADSASAAPSPEFQQAVADRFRRRNGLLRGADVDHWLTANRLSRQQFAKLLHDQALLEWTANDLAGDVAREVPDQLRLADQYARLIGRARHKQRVLAEFGWENPSLADAGCDRDELVRWYFQRLGRPVEADLEDYASRAGFADADALVRALVREFCYLKCLDQEVTNDTPAPAG